MLEKADRALERSIFYGSAALMLGLTGVILYAVIARYFFNKSPIWSEEVPRVIFLWVSYLAVAVAVRRGQSLRITFLLDRMPPLVRLVCELSMHASILVMLGFLIWHNVPVLQLLGQSKMLATQWPDSVRFWPLSVGCVLIALYELRFIIVALKEYRR